jgi:hypothetical protein
MRGEDKARWAQEALENPLLEQIYNQKLKALGEAMFDPDASDEDVLAARAKALVWREWWRELQFELK